MRLLLVTNVLSEVTKPRPDEAVLKWVHGLDEDRTFISIVSIAEIRRGVADGCWAKARRPGHMALI